MAENTAVPLNRIERVLASMIAGIGGLSVIAIIATIAAGSAGADLSSGAWPVVAVFPGLGLPVTFILIVVFAIVSIVRRRRIAADGSD